jgi:hypothetical protein
MLLALAVVALALIPARAAGPAVAQDASVAPQIASAVGVSRTKVRLRFTRPVDAGAVVADDVVLTMGGEPRTVSRVELGDGGETAEVEARPAWPYGTAGAVRLRGSADKSVRVWATPGDVTPPVLRGVRLDSTTVCVINISHDCARNGGTVRYTVDEPVSIVLDLRHRATDAPSLLRVARGAGRGSVRFGSKIEGRRLRPGTFRLTVTAVDPAGNESVPRTLRLRVRR